MNKFIQSALLAVSVGFLGLMISTQVRSQVRLDAEEVTTIRLQSFFKMPIGPKGLDVSKKILNTSGQKIRLTGYMAQNELPKQGVFMFSQRPVQLSEHADGDDYACFIFHQLFTQLKLLGYELFW